MMVLEYIQIGFNGLLTHKLRAFLTMLGIIFGVGAVVAMLSIGEGARQEALKQIELMGVNNIIIQDAGLSEEDLISARAGFSPGLTIADVNAIKEVLPQAEVVAPLRRDEVTVRYGSDEMKVNLIGVTPDYPYAQNLILKNGRFPDEQDLKTYKRVCAIGYGVKKELFPLTDPLGKDLKISNLWFKIVGVMEQKEVSAKKIGEYQIRNFNQDLMVPISCSEKLFYRPALISPLNEIIVKVKSGTEVQAAGNILQRLISRRHHQQDDFKVVIPEDLLRQSQATQRIFNIVMGAIASISLLVGGIGIMNIMLSSVLERTREIGICRAIGAKKAEIMGQYLTESVTLSFAGGIMGILLGMILAKVITFYAGWVTIISFFSVISAFAVATGVGLVFGLYPARRAANLNPIDALRFE